MINTSGTVCARILLIAIAFFCISTPLLATPPGGGWRLHFADEFSGDSIDSTKWLTTYPWGRTHNHGAYMEDENVVFGDGTASLIATRESAGGKQFTSGIISSGYNKYTFTGGYVESRILLPNTVGSWPAFWGLYTGWPPEADIMEYPIGAYNESEYHTAFHYSTGSGNASGAGKVNPSGVGDLGGSYHTFGMHWVEDDFVQFYFDDQPVRFFGNDSAIAQMEHMYLILNYAVGGWPPTPSTTQWPSGWADQTKIDWVRVWQQPSQTGTSTFSYNGSGTGNWNSSQNWSSFQPSHSGQEAHFDTLAGQGTMQVNVSKLKTVGALTFDGSTDYTIGSSTNTGDSIMLADQSDGWANISVTGTGTHRINTRLEAWSHVSISNLSANPLIIAEDLIGHARGSYGGKLLVRDSGSVTLGGGGYYQDETEVRGANFTVSAGLYQGAANDNARIYVNSGGKVSLSNVNDRNGSAGSLPRASSRLLLDSGELEVRDHRDPTTTRRGFTIGENGATLSSASGSTFVTFRPSENSPVVNPRGGTLTLEGAGSGRMAKVISGAGGIRKRETGIWFLDADNNYSGSTSVQAGTLLVNGTTGTGQTTVSAGAKLGGQGSVLGLLNNSGTIAPGQISTLFGVKKESTGRLTFDFSQAQSTGPLTDTSELDASLALTNGLDTGPGLNFISGASNEMNVNGWSTGLRSSNAIASDDYMAFTVEPIAGLEMQLDTASFELWRDAEASPRNFAVFSSLEGFTPFTTLGELHISDPDDGSSSNATDMIGFNNRRTLTGEYTGTLWTTNPVEVRLYGWGALGNGSAHITAADLTANFRTNGAGDTLTPTGQLHVGGNLFHVAGAGIELQIGGSDNTDPEAQQYDSLLIDGLADIAGDLTVSLTNGYVPVLGDLFDLFDFGSVTGSFANLTLPSLSGDLAWDTTQLLTTGVIEVISSQVPGDFDGDGHVGLSDLNILGSNFGTLGGATVATGDANGDGDVTLADLNSLGSNWNPPPVSTIPEPSTGMIMLLGASLFGLRLKR